MDSRKKKYLDKIVEHLVNRTKYDTDHLNLYIIKFPFSDSWEIFGSDREMSSIYDISPERFGIYRWNFDQEMIDVFDLIEHESDYVWEEYFKGARFFGNEYANSDGLINESKEGKQKEFLDKVVSRLINETEIDYNKREMYIPFSVDNTLALSIDYILLPHIDKYPPFIRHCKNIYGLTNEECDYAWRQYKKNIKGKCAENHKKKPWYKFLTNESIEDKQTEFLQKVVDIMIRDTKPFNETSTSVITPFIASKSTNGKYVLSANYCKKMVDYFEDEFAIGKIFNDYLEVFGLSDEEMEEVMYWYFNELFEKYFKRFFDLSYKTRPRLDESVDLGFVDKVTDMVLNEIVWDFDRGLVYLPMINYSASIRDDDFLSAVNADDPFSNRFSGDTRWHIDLMKHIEDTYGITGNEWGRVWGSLQGEIWDKTDKYWDSFTRGY